MQRSMYNVRVFINNNIIECGTLASCKHLVKHVFPKCKNHILTCICSPFWACLGWQSFSEAAAQQHLERPWFIMVGVSLEGEILPVGSQWGSDSTITMIMGNNNRTGSCSALPVFETLPSSTDYLYHLTGTAMVAC